VFRADLASAFFDTYMPNYLTCLSYAVAFGLLILSQYYPETLISSSTTQTYNITMSLSSKLSITDVNLKGEKVLIRVDFNVP
jgi:phosphoglycerate kinase